jgi:hypothetical protein
VFYKTLKAREIAPRQDRAASTPFAMSIVGKIFRCDCVYSTSRPSNDVFRSANMLGTGLNTPMNDDTQLAVRPGDSRPNGA